MNTTHHALRALRAAHALIMTAVQSTPTPSGPLLAAAVEVADAIEAQEEGAIGSAAEVLGHLWPPRRTCALLRRALRAGAVTVEEITAWVAAQARSGLEAHAARDALLDVVEAQEVALAARDGEPVRIVGGERG